MTTAINLPLLPLLQLPTTARLILLLKYCLTSLTPGACAGKYTITRTWTVADACGNALLIHTDYYR